MGSLKVEGSLEQPVTFLGDRIDRSVFVGVMKICQRVGAESILWKVVME